MKRFLIGANDLKKNIDISKFLDEKGRITKLSQKKNIRVAVIVL